MKVLLMGNPNVGKSVLFNRLTGVHTIQSNYPGTTVDFTKGYLSLEGEAVEVIDVPGTFSLDPKDKAEEAAVKMLEENEDSVVVCVLDGSKLERGLYLALEIIERGHPMLIALNMSDVAEERNVEIDTEEMESILGVPVVKTVAVDGKGLKELTSKIREASSPQISTIQGRVS